MEIEALSEENYMDLKKLLFLSKIPQEYKEELLLLLTPEAICGDYPPDDSVRVIRTFLNYSILNDDPNESIKELTELLDLMKENSVGSYYVFNKMMNQVDEYLKLRPNLIDEFPEHWI